MATQTNPTSETEKTAKIVEKIKKTINYLSDSNFDQLINYIYTIMDINLDLLKKALNYDLYGNILTKVRDSNVCSVYLEIGQKMQINFMEMDVSGNNSILQRVLKYPMRDTRKDIIEKILGICISQDKSKFIEIIKKSEINITQKTIIIDMMWKSQGKSIEKNFDELLNYVSSGVQINGSTPVYTQITFSSGITAYLTNQGQPSIITTTLPGDVMQPPIIGIPTGVSDNMCICCPHNKK